MGNKRLMLVAWLGYGFNSVTTMHVRVEYIDKLRCIRYQSVQWVVNFLF